MHVTVNSSVLTPLPENALRNSPNRTYIWNAPTLRYAKGELRSLSVFQGLVLLKPLALYPFTTRVEQPILLRTANEVIDVFGRDQEGNSGYRVGVISILVSCLLSPRRFRPVSFLVVFATCYLPTGRIRYLSNLARQWLKEWGIFYTRVGSILI